VLAKDDTYHNAQNLLDSCENSIETPDI